MFNPLQQVYIDSLRAQIAERRLVIPHTLPDTFQEDKWWVDEWNRLDTLAVSMRNEFFGDYLEELLLKAKTYYYSTGDTIISDKRYDALERNLKILRPNSTVLTKVGM